MLFSSRMQRIAFFIGFVALVPFVLAGCFWNTENPDAQRSQAGYFAEEFLSPTTPFVLSYSTLDGAQKDTLNTLKGKFPQLADFSVEKELVKGLGFEKWNFGGVQFADQFSALFATATRITFAADALNTETPQYYVFAVVGDAAAAKTLLDSVAAQSSGIVVASTDTVTGMPVYADAADAVFVSLIGDMIVMVGDENSLKDTLVRGVQKGESLATSSTYKETMANLPTAYVASLYFASSADFLTTLGMGTSVNSNIFGEGFVFVADNDGLNIEGYSKADNTIFDEFGVDRKSFIPDDLVLLDKVPGQNMVMASEGKNLGGVIDLVLKMMVKAQTKVEAENAAAEKAAVEANPSVGGEDVTSSTDDITTGDTVSSDQTDIYTSFRTKFKSFTELDWDTDVLTFLDQNYIVAMSATPGNIIPGITIMADAKDNADGAQKLIDKLDTQLEGLLMIVRLNAGTEGTDLFTKDTVTVGGAEAHRISVDFSKLSALMGGATAIPDVISSQTFELTYGVTGDNVFFVSTQPNFAAGYGTDVLSAQTNFKAAASHVDLKNGMVFVSPVALSGYLDSVISFQESLKGPLSADDRAQFEQIKTILNAFTAVLATPEVDGDVALTHGYVLLGQ